MRNVRKYLLSVAVVICTLIAAMPAGAVTVLIGDVDSFGFTSPFGVGPDGGPADRNSDGILTAGDTLPDLNANGSVATGSGDDFDNRSGAELFDANLVWTDVALSTSYGGRPGNPNDVSFLFTFAVPNPGDSDFGVNHFLNVVAGDLDTGSLQLTVDGTNFPLQGVGNDDGLVTLTYVEVPWSMMTDGQLQVDFNTPSEPYVAIDYILLDVDVNEADPVPVPATAGLAMLMFGGALARRRRGYRTS